MWWFLRRGHYVAESDYGNSLIELIKDRMSGYGAMQKGE